MAIIITSTPQTLTPGYNPVEFTFSGSNNTKAGYRYLVDIYSGNSNTLIARQRIAPLLDGTGKCDISRILNNFLDYDANLSSSLVPNNTLKSKFDYSIRIGEEYFLESWDFNRTVNFASPTQIIISSTTTNHQYVTNDKIQIYNASDSSMNGYWNVDNIESVRAVRINYQQGDTGVPALTASGTTILVGANKRQFSGITASTVFTIFNGVKKFEDFIVWSGVNYTLSGTSTTKQALTDQPPSNFFATPTQDLILNYYVSGATGDTYVIRYTTDTAFIQNTIAFTGSGGTQLIQFKVGPNNLTMPGNTIYYDIVLFKNIVTQLTKPYRITLDRRCPIEPLEILFMDRMGSMSSFAFNLRSQETGTVSRIQYKQQVGKNYNIYDRGNTNININFDKDYSLGTNFMTEEMSVYFEQLITSPYTWVKMNGQYLACMINDNSYEVVHQKNKRLIRYDIKIKLANSNNSNI